MGTELKIPRKVVMVVDDDESIRSFIRFSLDREGFEVIEQRSGDGALKILETRIPDIILLDIMMPGLDGFETMEIIRANKKYDKIPVIFITGSTETETKTKAEAAGAQGFMEKPLRFNELLRQIFDALNGHFSLPTRLKYSS